MEKDIWQPSEGTKSEILQNEERVILTDQLELQIQCRGDHAGHFVSDDCDALFRFQAQAIADRIARAGNQFRVDFDGIAEETVGHGSAQHYAEITGGQTCWSGGQTSSLSPPTSILLIASKIDRLEACRPSQAGCLTSIFNPSYVSSTI